MPDEKTYVNTPTGDEPINVNMENPYVNSASSDEKVYVNTPTGEEPEISEMENPFISNFADDDYNPYRSDKVPETESEPAIGSVYIDSDEEAAREAEARARKALEETRYVNRRMEPYIIDDEPQNQETNSNENEFSIFSNDALEDDDEKTYVNTPTGEEPTNVNMDNPYVSSASSDEKTYVNTPTGEEPTIVNMENPYRRDDVLKPEVEEEPPLGSVYIDEDEEEEKDLLEQAQKELESTLFVNDPVKPYDINNDPQDKVKESVKVTDVKALSEKFTDNKKNAEAHVADKENVHKRAVQNKKETTKAVYPINRNVIQYYDALRQSAQSARGIFHDSDEYMNFMDKLKTCEKIAKDLYKSGKERNHKDNIATMNENYVKAIGELKDAAKAYEDYKMQDHTRDKKAEPNKKKLNSQDKGKLELTGMVLSNKNVYLNPTIIKDKSKAM